MTAFERKMAQVSGGCTNQGGYPLACEKCGRKRTCNDAAMCHECTQAEMDAAVEVDANGEEWVPGGYRL